MKLYRQRMHLVGARPGGIISANGLPWLWLNYRRFAVILASLSS